MNQSKRSTNPSPHARHDDGTPAAGHPGDTSRALMAAGRKLFGKHGFDGTSVREIAQEAGANLGAITYHFGSKRALYSAVLEEGLRPMADRIVAVGSGPGAPLDRIVMVVEAFFAQLARDPNLPHLMLQEVSAGRIPPEPAVSHIRRIAHTLAGLHREGQADGSLRPGNSFLMAVSVAAQPLYLSLVAPLFHELSGIDLRDPAALEQAVAHTTSFVRAGLASREEAAS
jgi:AcrR family transcriptional regulator